MKCIQSIFLCLIWLMIVDTAFSQTKPGGFLLTISWEKNSEMGIVQVTPTEMLVIDSKGNKHERIISKKPVLGAYLSPDGRKLAYATEDEVWLEDLHNKTNTLIVKGFCDYFRWNTDSSGFVFAIGVEKHDMASLQYEIKLYWADGDGKNLKQVYP